MTAFLKKIKFMFADVVSHWGIWSLASEGGKVALFKQ